MITQALKMRAARSLETSEISIVITMLHGTTSAKNASPRLRLLLLCFGADCCFHLQHPPELFLVTVMVETTGFSETSERTYSTRARNENLTSFKPLHPSSLQII
jgi:hypothetical protein